MWEWLTKVSCRTAEHVRLVIPRVALAEIFNECDRFDRDETGGRVIGSYAKESAGELTIRVQGIIESGPGTQRSPVALFQDGEYQENIFREIERSHPEVEHLGNWHTHHVNGLRTLSAGDVATYRRTVNHSRHNTSFFYAALVTSKRDSSHPLSRYSMKHYLLLRGDNRVYEIEESKIQIVDRSLLWPRVLASIPMNGSGANILGGMGDHPKTRLSFRLSSQGMAGCLLSKAALSRSGLCARF
ncbi:MAG TPA: hypothetical protein P5555_07755 [Candidatus Paceibacterota bacterium]|nr:hypothetical protein [Verrucomicrobiota bacterium]HRZ45070.1 hypothetical protein [Candidatus Paceibacterota bacterium]